MWLRNLPDDQLHRTEHAFTAQDTLGEPVILSASDAEQGAMVLVVIDQDAPACLEVTPPGEAPVALPRPESLVF